MAKTFLRSGSLDAVLPLGENGQPVYLSALQLRETLRLRKQPQIADCLAIPQSNDAGDRLDWYSPISGKVTSWAAASDSARTHALNQLIACQQAVADMCQKAQYAEKTSQKLFGALLAKALQFPDQNFVYLVGGKPVLTFWGFVSLEKKSRQDALDCLRAVEDDEPPLNLSRLSAPVVPAIAAVPLAPIAPIVIPAIAAPVAEPVAAAAEVIAEPAVEPQSVEIKTAPKHALIRYGWMLPAAALLIAFGVQIKGCVSQPEPAKTQAASQAKAPAAVADGSDAAKAETSAATETAKPAAPQQPAAVTPAPAQPETTAETDKPAPVHAQSTAETVKPAPATLPVDSASVTADPAATAAAPEAAPEQPVVEAPPAAKDDLVMPADAVKQGSTKFLNGNWRVIVGGKNPITGKPPVLRYQIKNGKGVAKIVQGGGITCRVDVYAGLMSSGNLVINSRTKSRCSDGSRYQMPELVCKQGATGAAECSGQYDASTVLPMKMKRESK